MTYVKHRTDIIVWLDTTVLFVVTIICKTEVGQGRTIFSLDDRVADDLEDRPSTAKSAAEGRSSGCLTLLDLPRHFHILFCRRNSNRAFHFQMEGGQLRGTDGLED